MASDSTALKAFALLRVSLGGWLVWLALPNLDASFVSSFPSLIGTWTANQPDGPIHWILANLIAPYALRIAMVIPVAWVLAGAALIIGVLVRPVAIALAVIAVGLIVAAGPASPILANSAFLLLAILASFIIGDVGRIYGLDQFLFRAEDSDDVKPIKGKFKNAKQKAAVAHLNKQLRKTTTKKGKKATSEKVEV